MLWAPFLRLSGVVAGLLAAVALAARPEPDEGPSAAVAALAALAAAGLFAADRTVPRPAQTGVRTARLVRRRLLDVVPFAPAAGVLVLAGALTGLLVATGAASRPHNFSATTPPNPADGRHLGCLSGGVAQSGPWPGWHYAIPVLATVALATVAAVAALRSLVVRPLADAHRHQAASSVVGALGVVVATPLAGAAWFAYSVLGQPGVCDEPVMPGLRPWLLTLATMAATAGVYYAARTVGPLRPLSARR
ncbi:hypothetical protein [Dactylosporangium sp. CA-092794]|uniref:hypothetical protein n=1 Tax=Dactylosporangium sp. CA-092794 TaxID=3239929 RepID=UPI003D8CB0E5